MVAFHLSGILNYNFILLQKSRHKEPGTCPRGKKISICAPTKQQSFFTKKLVLIYVYLCKKLQCFFIQSHNIYENSNFLISIYQLGSFTYF